MTRKYRSVRRNNMKRYKSKMRGGTTIWDDTDRSQRELKQIRKAKEAAAAQKAIDDEIAKRNRESDIKEAYMNATVYNQRAMYNFTGEKTVKYPPNHTYQGKFFNGFRHGYGTLTGPNDRYVGNWEKDKRNGRGIETAPCYDNVTNKPTGSLSHYDGIFKDNLHSGKGKFTTCDGFIYTGDFEKDMFHGKGIFTKKPGMVYDGDFMNGNRHGIGKQILPSGIVYEGQWKDDNRHGIGKETSPDGTIYEGNFINNKKNGHGKLTDSSGILIEGEWENDKKISDS
jgi:hypothetical protein